jgi:hypothetical protein
MSDAGSITPADALGRRPDFSESRLGARRRSGGARVAASVDGISA